ncbi:MAG: flagellar filament capping protein FliD [Synergistetes bacterium]|nr:flagellar filament capping protein FliD [Synergistota bacterium]
MSRVYLLDRWVSIDNLKRAAYSFERIKGTRVDSFLDPSRKEAFLRKELSLSVQAWGELSSLINALNNALDEILKGGSFLPFEVSDGNGYYEISIASSFAGDETKHEVEILEVALPDKFYTTIEVSSPYEPLSLVGEISVNSVPISISSDDSLISIAGKINQYSEDTGVEAYVGDNKLYIESWNGLTIEGDESLLSSLGFERVSSRRSARYKLDGISYTSATNYVKDLLPGINMRISSEGKATFEISFYPTEVLRKAQDLVNDFNRLIERINAFLGYGGALEGDLDLASVRRNLIYPFLSSENRLYSAGFELKEYNLIYDEFSLLSYLGRLRGELASLWFRSADGIPSFIEALQRIGFLSEKNGTIGFNEREFVGALRDDWRSVRELLVGENGVFRRLKSFLDKVLSDGGLPFHKVNQAKSLLKYISSPDFRRMSYLSERERELLHKYEKLLYILGTISAQRGRLPIG